jgi:hypothetical protein
MRRQILYLTDIVESADHIQAFLTGIGFEAFLNSEMIRSAELALIDTGDSLPAAARRSGTSRPLGLPALHNPSSSITRSRTHRHAGLP